MSDSSDIVPPHATPWLVEGSITSRFVRVLEQVVVSGHADGKVRTIARDVGTSVSVKLDRETALHLAQLLSAP